MSDTPRVSVLVPVRNAQAFLADCLESIRAQTFDDFEVLIVDDGSCDSSVAIVAEAARRDNRFRSFNAGRVGLVGALQYGLRHARAPLLARMDADDLMHPRRLELQSQVFSDRIGVDVVAALVAAFPAELVGVGMREYLRWQDSCRSNTDIVDNMFFECPFVHPSAMLRTATLRAVGGYRAGSFPEDYELWLRLREHGARFYKLPERLLQWRQRFDSTSRLDPRCSREAFDRLRARYLHRELERRGGRAFVIWGAGRRTRRRAQRLLAFGRKPLAYIDIDPKKIGNTIDGIIVQPPTWLAEQAIRRIKPIVLVYVAAHGAKEQIAQALVELGWQCGTDFLAVG